MSKLGKQPLAYFRDLRTKSLEYESHPDSRVLKVKTESGEVIRMLHMQYFGPFTVPGIDAETGEETRTLLSDSTLFYNFPALLGVRDFNDRNSSIVPDLGELTKDCDVYLTMDMLDTQLIASRAVEMFYGLQAGVINTLENPIPGAIVGPATSRVSKQLAPIAGIYNIPMVSGGATSSALDSKFTAPSFARTIPTTAADARAIIIYLKDQLRVTHVGLIFLQGEFGESFRRDFVEATNSVGMKLAAVSYDDRNAESLKRSLQFLESTNYRYFLAVASNQFIGELLEGAYDTGLVGADYVWFLPGAVSLTQPGYSVSRERPGLAEAMRGSAVVTINTQLSDQFSHELIRAMTNDETFQDFYVSSHPESFIFDAYNFSGRTPALSAYSNTVYDAAISLGLAACRAEKDFFSPEEHYRNVLNVTFTGASGVIGFDQVTGTRRYDTLRYTVTNILQDDEVSVEGNFVFQPQIAAIIDFNDVTPIVQVNPFSFNSRSTDIPPALPSLEEELNLIPNSVRAIGWSLSIAILGLSLFFARWAIVRRRNDRVRAAQPLFLVLMCLGTALMASAIIPMSLQDPSPQHILDGSCMATMWLFMLGFAVAFGSVACKLIRVSRIFQEAMQMNRVVVSVWDSIWPLCFLVASNSIILCVWTIVSPRWYEREEFGTVDHFGRSTASYGLCQSSSKGYGVTLGVLNFLVVALCNYKAYRSRNIPSNFNESIYIALSNFFLLEGILIFAPILALVDENPTAEFLIEALLITFICLAILLPIFLSKIFVPPVQVQQRKVTDKNDCEEPNFQRGSLFIIRHEDVSVTDQILEAIAKERSKRQAADSGGASYSKSSGAEISDPTRADENLDISKERKRPNEIGEHSLTNLGSSVADLKESIRLREQASSCSLVGNSSCQHMSGTSFGSSVADPKASIREEKSTEASLDTK